MPRAGNGAKASAGSDGQAPGLGHNVDHEEATFLRHVRAIVTAQAIVEDAKNGLKSVRKLAKADGIELKKLDAVVTTTEWSPGEIRDHFGTLNRYALWMGLPVGTQADLFADVPEASRESVDWEARGYCAALTNKGAFAGKPPSECPPDRITDWQRGVNRATEKIAWSMSDAGHNPDRKKTGLGVSAVPLEPEPEGDEPDDTKAAALAGPTEAEAAFA